MRRVAPLFILCPFVLWGADATPPAPIQPLPAATNPTAVAPAAVILPAVPGVQIPPADVPSHWKLTGRFGAFFSNVNTTNADTSLDPTISGTSTSTSFLATYDGQANWKEDKNSIDNLLKARYGRIRTQGQDWTENNDELRYDGVYRRELVEPHFIYLGWGAESVFTGPDPYNYAFDPTTGKVSAGYGQRYEDFIPDKNSLEFRLGARAQKKWGKSLGRTEKGIETGIEAFIRYEHLLKRGDGEYDVRFFTQYEGFSEFNDLSHITNLITAGLTVQLTRYITIEMGIRAYYETRTKEDDRTLAGYNQWSIRQDSLFGLTYAY